MTLLLRIALALALTLALPLAIACSSTPPATEHTLGSRVAEVALEDQFGKTHELDERVAVVLFARDMAGGGIIKQVLADHPTALDANRAVYIADISGMPSFIATMSAIPKMRERPYPTLLDRDGHATAAFPAKDGHATILRLSSLEITEIQFTDSADTLGTALGVDLEAATD
jgi:hypothetical protein